MVTIQWYPGHMAKAKRQVQENLKYVDCVLEVVDARLPLSSQNPMLQNIIGDKPCLLVLNKADLADKLSLWWAYFPHMIAVDSKMQKTKKLVTTAVQDLLADKIARNKERGIQKTVVRAMVVGIPNSGKSTLLNTLAGKKSARTGNTPGVTRSQQWIRSNPELEILDTPGILWPKFEDPEVGMRLALTGAIKDDLIPLDDLVIWALDFWRAHYPLELAERYKVDFELSSAEMIESLTSKMGFHDDYERFYKIFINDVRNGKLGSFCLDELD